MSAAGTSAPIAVSLSDQDLRGGIYDWAVALARPEASPPRGAA